MCVCACLAFVLSGWRRDGMSPLSVMSVCKSETAYCVCYWVEYLLLDEELETFIGRSLKAKQGWGGSPFAVLPERRDCVH